MRMPIAPIVIIVFFLLKQMTNRKGYQRRKQKEGEVTVKEAQSITKQKPRWQGCGLRN
jgi:hypothetical protein